MLITGEWGGHADARAIMRRLDDLIAGFEAHPDPQVRAGVLELLQGIDTLHRQGLARLVERIREASGEAIVEEAQADPLVRLLLGLYDLAELDLPPAPEPAHEPAPEPAREPAPEPAHEAAPERVSSRSSRPPASAPGTGPAFVPLHQIRVRSGRRRR